MLAHRGHTSDYFYIIRLRKALQLVQVLCAVPPCTAHPYADFPLRTPATCDLPPAPPSAHVILALVPSHEWLTDVGLMTLY